MSTKDSIVEHEKNRWFTVSLIFSMRPPTSTLAVLSLFLKVNPVKFYCSIIFWLFYSLKTVKKSAYFLFKALRRKNCLPLTVFRRSSEEQRWWIVQSTEITAKDKLPTIDRQSFQQRTKHKLCRYCGFFGRIRNERKTIKL